MQGNLESANLADLLLNLHLARRSGILRVSQSDVKKSIYFLDGSIVFAHSNQKYDRLGETLLRLGKITLEEFEIASREVIEKGKRLGQALSDLGFISAQEVSSSVHYQLQQITYSLFDWDSGEFEFLERERPVFEDIMIDISTPNLIIEGVRNMTNPDLLERFYQKNEQQVLFLGHGVPRLPRTSLDFAEETILACVDETKTIEGIRQLAHLARIEFDRGLCSLLVCGMLQLHQDTEAMSGTSQSHSEEEEAQEQRAFTTQKMEEIPHDQRDPANGMKTLSEAELRRLITVTEKKFEEATDEEVLNVLPDCTLSEIHRAYEDLRAQFHPPYYSQNRFLDVKDPLKAILDRLTLAQRNLIARTREQSLLSETPLEALQHVPSGSGVTSSEQKPSRQEKPPPVMETNTQKEPISELQARIAKDPGNTVLLRRLGKRFQETGKPHEGEKQLLRALELEPQNIENHFALAEFYNCMGLKIKAFKHLNIVLQLQPNNEQAMELLNLKKIKKALYEIEH